MATLAGASTGTVSNVLNRPDTVRQATRERVEKAIAEVGFVRQASFAREADEGLGHEDGSVSARYTHVTDTIRALLMNQLTEVWHESLDDRLLLAPRSPAPILDRMLQQRAAER
ncbi:LacI family DNA-binding transcriptional regulator [Streptomyces sp. KMM 9044]|uniref:LacI family DNA-binding transcriptional regulator n=1 Tax=Streptomyces sp. KMM 9044 TaxID=2744474 RepID=UPI0021512848|nr:LacI family DNA-binding transcriptional regulator [Streptomyces sp. KMM 9044]WAX78881.1 LacI family DNA-binding transcriptional regulator [Streptomyces sp. KMM 9044]